MLQAWPWSTLCHAKAVLKPPQMVPRVLYLHHLQLVSAINLSLSSTRLRMLWANAMLSLRMGTVKGLPRTSQKLEPESGPSSGGYTKRKRPLKLTPSQRERKRAIDREAQRSIRMKTKNYIAHLENLVKLMEQNDTGGPEGENSRTHELTNQLKQSQEEVRSLREAMLGIQRTLSTVLGDPSILNADLPPQRQSSYSASPPSVAEAQNTTTFIEPSHSISKPQASGRTTSNSIA